MTRAEHYRLLDYRGVINCSASSLAHPACGSHGAISDSLPLAMVCSFIAVSSKYRPHKLIGGLIIFDKLQMLENCCYILQRHLVTSYYHHHNLQDLTSPPANHGKKLCCGKIDEQSS